MDRRAIQKWIKKRGDMGKMWIKRDIRKLIKDYTEVDGMKNKEN